MHCVALSLLLLAAGADESAAALFQRGNTAMEQGRIEEARDAFAKASTSAPTWGLAFLSYGIAEQTIAPESDKARIAFERAVQLEPENPKAHYHLGLSYEHLGRFSEAAAQYRAAIAKRPQMLDAHYQLGSVLRMAGDDTNALLAFEGLLKVAPDNAGAWLTVAEIYEKAARYDDAEMALITVTRLAPTVAYHQYRLAKFYERIGDAPKARSAFARADSLKAPPKRKMRPLLPSK